MLQDQIIAEINQIPSEKLPEIYDLIHYFRLGLMQEQQPEPAKKTESIATRWRGQFKLVESADDARGDYLKDRYQL